MKDFKIWANYKVGDILKTKGFYEFLGIPLHAFLPEMKLVSFRFGEAGFIINFFENNSQIDPYLPSGYGAICEIIMSISATSRQEVYEWFARVQAAGGILESAPFEDEQGYFGFVFSDLDEHRFNILLM